MNDLGDPQLQRQLKHLHGMSGQQETLITDYFRDRRDSVDWGRLDDQAHRFLADKLVALDPDKAMFFHRLCVALRARRVMEVGTSHGVSTLYLAQAMKHLEAADGQRGVVIATE